MKKNMLTFVSLVFIILSCKNSSKSSEENSKKIKTKIEEKSSFSVEKMITWDEMIVEINKGTYSSIGQSHDLIVSLVSSDGTILKAKQPKIDALIEVVLKCSKCKDKPILSE